MNKLPIALALAILLGLNACITKNSSDLPDGTGYSTPEEAGISSGGILQFINALEESQPDALHSVMIRRHGNIIARGWWEPYAPETPHLLWSLSKSFTSTAIGMAQDEGLLSIDDQVISFFPEDIPEEPSANLKAMRIRDLLRMNTGQASEPDFRTLQSDNWVRVFLEHPVDFKPGTHFDYNSLATYMCSAIIQKVSGKSTLDYLTPRLFEPLGIKKPGWETCPKGISVGGWGLSLRTEDISKFGQLMLQKGMWNGKQFISEAWVEEASGFQTSNGSNPESDWEQGYGYQFWQCRNNAYRGDGAFGQYCIVMPRQDAVVAITSGSDDMQGILNVVWDILLPAMKEEVLPPDESGLEELNRKLNSLSLSYLKGEESSPLAPEISGHTYLLEENELSVKSLSFDFETIPNEIFILDDQGEQIIKAGFGKREWGSLGSPYVTSGKVSVEGAWTAPDTYKVNVIYHETPESVLYTFRFEDDILLWDFERKASFGPRHPAQLKAKRK